MNIRELSKSFFKKQHVFLWPNISTYSMKQKVERINYFLHTLLKMIEIQCCILYKAFILALLFLIRFLIAKIIFSSSANLFICTSVHFKMHTINPAIITDIVEKMGNKQSMDIFGMSNSFLKILLKILFLSLPFPPLTLLINLFQREKYLLN